MTNGTKIKTMKDDLLEIENKLSQSSKVPEKQQKTPTPAANVPAIHTQRMNASFSAPKISTAPEDLKTKELRNIVNRLSKNKSASGVSAVTAKPQSAEQTAAVAKAPSSDKDDLRALIERISKREGETEKPLAKPAEPVEITLATEPEIGTKPQIKPELEIVAVKTKTEPAIEKPDLEKLIKPIEKPQINKEDVKEPPIEKIVSKSEPAIAPASKPAIVEEEIEIEKKEEELKEIFSNITKKESELKNLLEKFSHKKGTEEKPAQPEQDAEQKAETKRSERTDKLIKPAEKTAPRKTINAPTITPIRPLPKPRSISPAEITFKNEEIALAPELKPIQAVSMKKKESPIMMKIRERLFGIEKTEIAAKKDGAVEKTESELKPVLKKTTSKTGPIAGKKTPELSVLPKTSEKETNNYFRKISDSKKTTEPKLDKVEEKFSNLQDNRPGSELKPEKINEFESSSGIIKTDSQEDRKKEEELAKAKRSYLDSQYVSPSSRLVFGKQEHYSSIRKHIEERHLDANLKEMESKVAADKNVILSDKEEKKKLKERIVSKYHIKSPSTLRNILIVAIIIIAIAGGGLYTYLSKLDVVPPEVVVPPVPGKELASLASISDSIEITTENLKNPIILREEIAKKFSTDLNLRFFKLVIKNDKVNYVRLNSALDGISIRTEFLPQAFLEQTEDEYSILVFKTQKSTARLGLAIKLKPKNTMSDVMMNWERDKSKMKDALNPIFVSDRSSDIQNSYFQAGNYKGVSIRYVSLPDKDTAIDYFIHDNTLVIATTKDDTFRLIDILTSVK